MSLSLRKPAIRRLALLALASAGLGIPASAQATFSIDWHSVTVGAPEGCSLTPITEGDILTPLAGAAAFGPLGAPCIAIDGGATGVGMMGFFTCIGHPGGTPCRVELDALSYGNDARMESAAGSLGIYLFSTDEYAVGGVAPVLAPSLATEAPVGDSSTDIWRSGSGLPPGPHAPFASPVGHIGLFDGDGLLSGSAEVYPGLGLVEPNFPIVPNVGDNLDAFDLDETFSGTAFPATGVFYSLDAAYVDPLTGQINVGTGGGNLASGADVLISIAPGGPPAIWAPAALLGLSLTGFEDDLDALAVWENGTGTFEPSQVPYDWMVAGGPDMVLFSVRRGSPVVGMPDSIFGVPICEGDILTTPLPTGSGGVSPFPGIFCAAENLGLATSRVPGGFSDDVNALDTLASSTPDCNGNGIPDSIDVSSGASTDLNTNGIPDECEIVGGPSCFCTSIWAPCGNAYPSGGCENSTGVGGLLNATGTGSVFLDDLVLDATQLPPTVPAIFFGGTFPVGPLPFGDGLRCAGGNIRRITPPMLTTATGTLSTGPGIAAANGFVPFESWIFQCWYRDPSGPCGNGFNLTHSYSVTFTP